MNRHFIVRDRAFLWEMSDDFIVLCMNGHTYRASEGVPVDLVGRWENPMSNTAASFVAEEIRNRFGNERSQWPSIAVKFCDGQNQ